MIRKMQKTDVGEVAEYVSEALSIEFEKIGEGVYSPDESKKDIAFGFDNDWIQLVYEIDGKNVGFISGTIEEGEGNIITLVVGKNHRRSGIGSALFTEMMKIFQKQDISKVNLNIHYRNTTAIAFFRKFGFTERTIEFSKDL